MLTPPIPDIGASGTFVLKAPFNSIVSSTTVLTVQSIRSVSDLIANDQDVFTSFYEPRGLSKEIYQEDVLAGVQIVGLQAGTGTWFYVPSTYFLSFPNIDGVMYTVVGMVVDLGAVPNTLELDTLKANTRDLVLKNLGVESDIEFVSLSQSALVSFDNHEKIEAARTAKVEVKVPLSVVVSQQQVIINELREKLAALEAFIRSVSPP